MECNGGINIFMFFSGLHRFFRILKITADVDGCMEFEGARQNQAVRLPLAVLLELEP